MNDHSASHPELPRTAYLDHTLRRARTAAEQRSHRYVTLEHLLLALLDDPDATQLLRNLGADSAIIQSGVADAVNNRMGALVVPDGRAPNFSYKFDGLFLTASEDAIRIGRREIDGGLALIAIAKDSSSNASVILTANGFYPAAALEFLAPSRPQPRPVQSPHVAQSLPAHTMPNRPHPPVRAPQISSPGFDAGPVGAPNLAAQAASMTSGEVSMDDMLASVRNILDAEERKERGLPLGGPLPSPPVPPRATPRIEPQLRAAEHAARQGQRGGTDFRRDAASQGHESGSQSRRVEPSFGHAPPLPFGPPAGGFSAPAGAAYEPPLPATGFDGEPRAEKGKKRPKARDQKGAGSRGETPGLVPKILEHIPRKTRVAVPEKVQIRLSKEEAEIIFGRSTRRGQPQLGGTLAPACRAVTIRLGAPEGGFFIEALAPETQWLFDRPAFLGDEAFGNWGWMLIPSESGSYPLIVSMSARDVDENGLAGDLTLPEQAIKIHVRGNFWRGFGRVVRTVFVLLAGSGLTVAAYYALKITGKIPH